MRTTQVHIYSNNFTNNIIQVRKFIHKSVKICVPVKADAYGHGAITIARLAIQQGVSFLAVATIQEAIELRDANITIPILILSSPSFDEIPFIVTYNITPIVFDKDFIDELEQQASLVNKIVSVHLKVDTGMGRVGCQVEEALPLAQYIQQKKSLYLEGLCSHLSSADCFTQEDIEWTKKQIDIFTSVVQTFKDNKINPDIIHCANSAATIFYPESHFNMVRPGLILYGYLDCNIDDEYITVKTGNKNPFLPVMALETSVSFIKKIKKGDSVSYGRTWYAPEDTWIATLPIGYEDGLLRKFSPGLTVTINGKRYPLVGRICMDQCMVNLGQQTDVKRWDKVIIFGDGKNALSALDLAHIVDTIPYEITCCIGRRVPRIYH